MAVPDPKYNYMISFHYNLLLFLMCFHFFQLYDVCKKEPGQYKIVHGHASFIALLLYRFCDEAKKL